MTTPSGTAASRSPCCCTHDTCSRHNHQGTALSSLLSPFIDDIYSICVLLSKVAGSTTSSLKWNACTARLLCM